MPRFTFHSLGLKIGAVIVLAQIVVMSLLGVYYIERFSQQIDQRVQTQIKIPGSLMNAGLLNYDAIDDKSQLLTLVGNDVRQAMVIGTDRTVFHASDPKLIGENAQYIPNFDVSWLRSQYFTQQVHDTTGTYLVSVTPIYSGSGSKTPFLFLYLRVSVDSIQSQKEFIKLIFALGSVLSVALTTLVIATSFYLVIFKRLRQLVDLSHLISHGQLAQAQAVPLATTKDELGDLALSFREMIHDLINSQNKLRDYAQGLEQKVQARTAQLNENVKELEIEKDVAERERAKDEAILSSIGEGVIATDKAGNVLIMNNIAEDILDLDHGANVGKAMVSLFSLANETGAAIPAEEHPLYITITKGQKISKTFVFTKKDARKITINITSAPVVQKNAQGQENIVGTINIIRDITKEKEIDRMKTEFISLASHQLRTPLSAIKWFSEMLLSGDAGALNSDQTDFAKNISDSTERMIQLVTSLLNISRMESGRIMIDPQPTDLKELIESLAKELQVKVLERHQNLIISVHDDLPKINLDAKLIRQVYLNLLTNAIKYTPKGGEISVFISRKDDQIISQVTDNGYGIPVAEQPKMFQKFFRAANVAKVETDGTGLGLYLIKAVIDASKGKIWFKSEEGKGTTFWFSLPMSGMQAKKGEVTLDE
ncbi:MAG TPA: ATP-binding protein [Candidatus Saccharimonadales bacterium]|nr:ATP-binding protein [Candidatus Saccharimonadales bacterium]